MTSVRSLPTPTQLVLRILAAAGLAVDAYAHADLASRFDGNGMYLSEGSLFRVQCVPHRTTTRRAAAAPSAERRGVAR
jgi:hypothetical protein